MATESLKEPCHPWRFVLLFCPRCEEIFRRELETKFEQEWRQCGGNVIISRKHMSVPIEFVGFLLRATLSPSHLSSFCVWKKHSFFFTRFFFIHLHHIWAVFVRGSKLFLSLDSSWNQLSMVANPNPRHLSSQVIRCAQLINHVP
jgi:hypothetical protein